jgi:predicted lipid-binding transport protein (Tim44 family)
MGKWLLFSGILALGGALVVTDAEARRFGGARNLGAQRNVTAPPAQTPAKPAQQAAPAQQGTQSAAAQSGSRWMPILGGLALGGMLGYLFGGNGLMGILLIAGLAILAVMAVRAFARRRQGHEVMRPVQYAGMRESVNIPVSTAPVAATATSGAAIPAGFDASGFLRAAKVNFLKLQAANDNGRLEDIREFTTDELYAELKNDVGEKQQTDVAGLEADLLEFVTEGDRHWASVRFTGMVREAPRGQAEAFSEVWNLVKPADGSTGWLLAGIQQMH